jgi:hypothetical protein
MKLFFIKMEQHKIVEQPLVIMRQINLFMPLQPEVIQQKQTLVIHLLPYQAVIKMLMDMAPLNMRCLVDTIHYAQKI